MAGSEATVIIWIVLLWNRWLHTRDAPILFGLKWYQISSSPDRRLSDLTAKHPQLFLTLLEVDCQCYADRVYHPCIFSNVLDSANFQRSPDGTHFVCIEKTSTKEGRRTEIAYQEKPSKLYPSSSPIRPYSSHIWRSCHYRLRLLFFSSNRFPWKRFDWELSWDQRRLPPNQDNVLRAGGFPVLFCF